MPVDYAPTVLDNTETLIISNDMEVGTSVWDTAGEEGNARIRTLSYPKTNLFILMFSVVNELTFVNVKVSHLKSGFGAVLVINTTVVLPIQAGLFELLSIQQYKYVFVYCNPNQYEKLLRVSKVDF